MQREGFEQGHKEVWQGQGQESKGDSMKNQNVFCAVCAIAIMALLFSGCSTSGSQPAKSQTATFDSCVFNITLPQTAKVEGVTLEIGTQAQYLESNGTETYAPEATPTTTASPTTTLSVPQSALGLGGAVSDLSAAAVKGTAKGINSLCKDGECSDREDGSCEDR